MGPLFSFEVDFAIPVVVISEAAIVVVIVSVIRQPLRCSPSPRLLPCMIQPGRRWRD